eukprot:2581933-Rhodomonas_salina.2
MPGTELGYCPGAGSSGRGCRCPPIRYLSTRRTVAYGAMRCAVLSCYAASGTELAYGAMRRAVLS